MPEIVPAGGPAVTAQQPLYPQQMVARGGAIAGLVIGLLAVASAFFTSAAMIVAVLGIGMGVWGLYSDRRGMAILGITLCCAAIAFAGVQGVALYYERLHGVSPWDELDGALDLPTTK